MYLYGAGGHAKVIIDSILEENVHTVDAVYDDFTTETEILNFSIEKNIENIPADASFVISIGNNIVRKKIAEKFQRKYETVVHPSAIISKNNVHIGHGTVIMASATINPAVTIGKHCIINTASIVEHDCFIDDYVHISPNATITGNVSIGEGTQIGAGVVVIPGVTIGKWCVIGAGSTVIRDIPDYTVAVGCPATTIKKHEVDL